MSSHRSIGDEYKEIRMLGRGAFGDAILARHVPTKTLYVLKRLPYSSPTTEEEKKERSVAEREVNVLCVLQHPYITTYKESFIDLDNHYLNIVLEYCEGGDLRNVIMAASKSPRRNGKKYVPEDKIWAWATQLLFALKYIHSKHILHRDLKPANIFLTAKNQIKLGDFGIAKVVSGTIYETATKGPGLTGTVPYIPPEACNGEVYTEKGDIWSLGVSLYELCALQLPFGAGNILALVHNITTKTPKPMPAIYSPKLQKMIFEMLIKDPQKRPTAEQIIDDFLGQEVVRRMDRVINQHMELTSPGIPLRLPPDRSDLHRRSGTIDKDFQKSARSTGQKAPVPLQPPSVPSPPRTPVPADGQVSNQMDLPSQIPEPPDTRQEMTNERADSRGLTPQQQNSMSIPRPRAPLTPPSPLNFAPSSPPSSQGNDCASPLQPVDGIYSLEPEFSDPPKMDEKRPSAFLRKGSGMRTSLGTGENFIHYQRKLNAVPPRVDLSSKPFANAEVEEDYTVDLLFVKHRKHILHVVLETFVTPQSSGLPAMNEMSDMEVEESAGSASDSPFSPGHGPEETASPIPEDDDLDDIQEIPLEVDRVPPPLRHVSRGSMMTTLSARRGSFDFPESPDGTTPPRNPAPAHWRPDSGYDSVGSDVADFTSPDLVIPLVHDISPPLLNGMAVEDLREPTVLGSGRRFTPLDMDARASVGMLPSRMHLDDRPLSTLSMMSVESDYLKDIPLLATKVPPLPPMYSPINTKLPESSMTPRSDISVQSYSPPSTAQGNSRQEPMMRKSSPEWPPIPQHSIHSHIATMVIDQDSEFRCEGQLGDEVVVLTQSLSREPGMAPLNAWSEDGRRELEILPSARTTVMVTPHKVTIEVLEKKKPSSTAIFSSCSCCTM